MPESKEATFIAAEPPCGFFSGIPRQLIGFGIRVMLDARPVHATVDHWTHMISKSASPVDSMCEPLRALPRVPTHADPQTASIDLQVLISLNPFQHPGMREELGIEGGDE